MNNLNNLNSRHIRLDSKKVNQCNKHALFKALEKHQVEKEDEHSIWDNPDDNPPKKSYASNSKFRTHTQFSNKHKQGYDENLRNTSSTNNTNDGLKKNYSSVMKYNKKPITTEEMQRSASVTGKHGHLLFKEASELRKDVVNNFIRKTINTHNNGRLNQSNKLNKSHTVELKKTKTNYLEESRNNRATKIIDLNNELQAKEATLSEVTQKLKQYENEFNNDRELIAYAKFKLENSPQATLEETHKLIDGLCNNLYYDDFS